MFDHIGRRIRTLARVICLMGFVISGIAMISIWITGGGLSSRGGFTIFGAGLLAGVAGALTSWILGSLAYGFGVLIEDVEAIRHFTEDTQYGVESLRRLGEEYRRGGPRQRPAEEAEG